MIRLILTITAACLCAGVFLSESYAQANSANPADAAAAFSEAGERIKQGATDIGHGIKTGAEVVGEKVKNTAVDLWESGKSAVDAGSRTMSERKAAPQAK